jgi:pimeloyl-ACP methyl ester carboxylesterase
MCSIKLNSKAINGSLILNYVTIIFLTVMLSQSCRQKEPESDDTFNIEAVISVDSVLISYDEKGSGSPELVFVHGWSCDKSYWSKQVEYFAPKYKVVTIDLAGHGASGMERKNYTMEAFGADVATVIKKLDLKKVVLIGHSMGGAVILEAARLTPGRIIGLVGADTFQDFERSYTLQEIEQFLTPFRENFLETVNDFVLNMFPLNADSILVESIIKDMSSAPKEVAISAMANLFSYDAKPTLKQVRLPIQLINCEKYPVNIEAGKRQAFSFEVAVIPEVGHFVMMEDAESFNRLLEETIRKLSGEAI